MTKTLEELYSSAYGTYNFTNYTLAEKNYNI